MFLELSTVVVRVVIKIELNTESAVIDHIW